MAPMYILDISYGSFFKDFCQFFSIDNNDRYNVRQSVPCRDKPEDCHFPDDFQELIGAKPGEIKSSYWISIVVTFP